MRISINRLREAIKSKGLTQQQLARLTDLSRGRINTILRNEVAEVRQVTLDLLASALMIPKEGLLSDEEVLAFYKARVADLNRNLDFRGFAFVHAQRMRLEDLFVPVRVRREIDQKDDCEEDPDGLRSKATIRKSSDRVSIKEVRDHLVEYDRILLRGEPGSGKTTVLRELALSFAEGRHEANGYSRGLGLIPIFVRLADYTKAKEQAVHLDLVSFAAASVRESGRPDPEPTLRAQLREGNCIVLLDGLDEVTNRESLSCSLQEFISTYPSNRFVVTSRTIGVEQEAWRMHGFVSFAITSWRDQDIAHFVRKWCAAQHGHAVSRHCAECATETDKLVHTIVTHPRVRAIAANPLMLTLLGLLHHANFAFPRHRVQLYAKVVDTFLDSWEASKHSAPTGDSIRDISLEARDYGWLLATLALDMHRAGLTLCARWWLVDHVQSFLQEHLGLEYDTAKMQTDHILRYLHERSGFLVERGSNLFCFSHLTFQEYFASRALIDEALTPGKPDILRLLRPYFYHPRWSEVVRLVCAQLPSPQATLLIRAILDDPDPAGRFLKRGPFLALNCLSDGAVITDKQVMDDIAADVAHVGESKWLGITLNALHDLRELTGTRYEPQGEAITKTIVADAKKRLSPEAFMSIQMETSGVDTDCIINEIKNAIGSLGLPVSDGELQAYLGDGNSHKRAKLLKLLLDPSKNDQAKTAVIPFLASSVVSSEKVRKVLEDLLKSNKTVELRSICALALTEAAAKVSATRKLLMDILQNNRIPAAVREDCAWALREAVNRDQGACQALLSIVKSTGPDVVRRGAVYALASVVHTEDEVREVLTRIFSSKNESASVRVGCACALSDFLGRDESVTGQMKSLLADSEAPRLSRIAAQELAEAFAANRLEWSSELAAKIEQILMGLKSPCPHALAALKGLVDAREIHAGVRLESVLQGVLAPLADQMDLVIVFGSVARRTQSRNSDVDLLVVGEVRLMELTNQLTRAEQFLGRQVNPIIYSRESFRQKYRSGDPFLLNVSRHEKIFVKGTDNELRAMVAEEVHPSPRSDVGGNSTAVRCGGSRSFRRAGATIERR